VLLAIVLVETICNRQEEGVIIPFESQEDGMCYVVCELQ
jgi:hypothetical protein